MRSPRDARDTSNVEARAGERVQDEAPLFDIRPPELSCVAKIAKVLTQ